MKFLAATTCVAGFVLAGACGAANKPVPSPQDSRIGTIIYNPADVAVIDVRRGTVTRIVLGANEKILPDRAATGFPADCSKPELEWCIHASAGGNQILVKPNEGATYNNLELSTNLHDYSLALNVLPDSGGTSKAGARTPPPQPMYRVIFEYRGTPRAPAPTRPASSHRAEVMELASNALTPRASEPADERNWAYTMQQGPQSDGIKPSLVFDDGRFTYFRFPFTREIPTIYAISPSGEESRVNFHMESADPSLVVVQRTGSRFVLRLGTAAIGIWNEKPNTGDEGRPPLDGTTIPGLVRVVRGASQ